MKNEQRMATITRLATRFTFTLGCRPDRGASWLPGRREGRRLTPHGETVRFRDVRPASHPGRCGEGPARPITLVATWCRRKGAPPERRPQPIGAQPLQPSRGEGRWERNRHGRLTRIHALSRVLVLALLLACQSVGAFYHPHTGRWLSRDPIGEAGGKRLYAFAINNPANNCDLLGMIIEAPCEAGVATYLKQNGVSEFKSKNANKVITFSGHPEAAVMLGVKSEILAAMIKSSRVFSVPSLSSLEKHVNMRLTVISFSSQASFSYAVGSAMKMNGKYWQPQGQGVTLQWSLIDATKKKEAINDLLINPSAYAIGCEAAADLSLLGGILMAEGYETLTVDKPVANDDWIPGEAGYISNSGWNGALGLEGENIIYIGSGMFWGHTPGKKSTLSLADWFYSIFLWNSSNPPILNDFRKRPPIPK